MRTEQDVRENPQPGDVARKRGQSKESRKVAAIVGNVVQCDRLNSRGIKIGWVCPWLKEWRCWARDAEVLKIGGNE